MIHEEEITIERMLSLHPWTEHERSILLYVGPMSHPLIAGWDNDEFIGVAGLATTDFESAYAWAQPCGWDKHKVALALHVRRFVRRWTKHYKTIRGNCSDKNFRWTQLCLNAQPTGELGPYLSYEVSNANV